MNKNNKDIVQGSLLVVAAILMFWAAIWIVAIMTGRV